MRRFSLFAYFLLLLSAPSAARSELPVTLDDFLPTRSIGQTFVICAASDPDDVELAVRLVDECLLSGDDEDSFRECMMYQYRVRNCGIPTDVNEAECRSLRIAMGCVRSLFRLLYPPYGILPNY